MGSIKAICISEKRGTQKQEVEEAVVIEDFGIENDAHAGNWHRQVSLLSFETIEAFRQKGANVQNGAFGENLIVSGMNLVELPVGTLLACNTVLLEVTQIGKECHSHCTIYESMGECIMPNNGIFTRVIQGGHIRKGDAVSICIKQQSSP